MKKHILAHFNAFPGLLPNDIGYRRVAARVKLRASGIIAVILVFCVHFWGRVVNVCIILKKVVFKHRIAQGNLFRELGSVNADGPVGVIK